MMTDVKLTDILNQEEYKDLTWNNYFEDIGEGRKYKGQWIKGNQWEGEKNKGYSKSKKDDKTNTGISTNVVQWYGFGSIEFPDGSKYLGQTASGKFNGVGRMVHPNGDIYQG